MKRFVAIVCLFALIGSVSAHAAFTRTLKLGDRGQDVQELQAILNSDGDTRIAESGVGAPGYESQYFGLKTQSAVRKFQQKYLSEILAPAGLTYPTGFVGSRTIAKLVTLGKTSVVSTPVISGNPEAPVQLITSKPSIASINPDIITTLNQNVTITGSGFLPYGNTVMLSSESKYGYDASSVDGKTLVLSVPFSLAEKIKSQIAQYEGTSNYDKVVTSIVAGMTGSETVVKNGKTYIRVIVVVKNSNGESGPASLLVDLSAVMRSL